VSISDDSQGNGTAGRILTSQPKAGCIFYETGAQFKYKKLFTQGGFAMTLLISISALLLLLLAASSGQSPASVVIVPPTVTSQSNNGPLILLMSLLVIALIALSRLGS
jgi:hypothetical protein